MDALELVSVVERLGIGVCPICKSQLSYARGEFTTGTLDKNGMPISSIIIRENHMVYCKVCGYKAPAIQIGLKEVVVAEKALLSKEPDKEKLEEIEDNIAMARRLLCPVNRINHPSNYMVNSIDIFGDGMFFVDWY